MTQDEMNQVMEKNPFAKYLDMKLIMVERGLAVGTIPMREEYSNIYGGMHGGCIFALADMIAGIAAASYGRMVTTLNTDFHYLEAIEDTKEVLCEAKALRHGGRTTVMDVKVYDDKRKQVCAGTFTYYNLKNESHIRDFLEGEPDKPLDKNE